MNVADLLSRQAQARPGGIAVIHEEQTFTYAEFESLVWGLCRHLHDAGLKCGSTVGFDLDDPLMHLAAIWALARLGVTAVSVTAVGNSAGVRNDILGRTGAAAMLTEPGAHRWNVPSQILVSRAQMLNFSGEPAQDLRCDLPEGWLHYKTSSGTTGSPKIIGATHAGMVASIEREIAGVGYPVGERYLTPVSLSFDGPRRRYMACLAAGGTAVLPSAARDLKAWIETMDRHDVRHFSCVPSQAHDLASSLPPGQQRFPAMRIFRLSAGPSDVSLHALLRERLTSNILISYGCTELGPLTVATPGLLALHPRSVGRPMNGVDVQVVSEPGEVLTPGQVGLIRLRAVGMPSEYLDAPELTARFFRDGWFYPGDLGRLDEQGLLFHMGRADGMMVLDGINIYPAEIEQALFTHPAVRDVVAFPFKHKVLNDVPLCAVALNEGQSASEQELMDFARRRLGSHSPQRIAILKAIPRNEHGKVQRPSLAEAVAACFKGEDLEPPPLAIQASTSSGGVLGQLLCAVKVRLEVPDRFERDSLDRWLHGVIGPNAIDEPEGKNVRQSEANARALALLDQTLLLSRWILQAARIPVFDRPTVADLRPVPEKGGQWQARALFARVDELPSVAYDIALQGASRLTTWAIAHPFEPQNLQVFYGLMAKEVLSRLVRLWPSGKSTIQVLRAAHRLSIPFTHLGSGVFQLGWGDRARRVDRSAIERDTAFGVKLANDKAVSGALLRKAGFPAPVHRVVGDMAAAVHAAHQIGWPIVVKPADRERGEGVAVDLCNDEQLKPAFEAALKLSAAKKVIIERQVEGVCHRLFMNNGRLLYAVKRLPMSVVGDGTSDVAALIDMEVQRQMQLPPWERSGIRPLDDLARAELGRAGLAPNSVPLKDQRVALRRIESTQWGGVDEDVTQRIHPENLKIASDATVLFGLAVVGVDIITPDISRPWFENGAIINEVNFAPLLGGGEISRSCLPAFLASLIEGNGMIPVEVFVGGEAAWIAGTQRWRSLVSAGVQAYLSHERCTLRPSGEEWRMPATGLYPRTRAMVLSSNAQALVLVVRTDEFLVSGLPLEAVRSVAIVDRHIGPFPLDGAGPSPERLDLLLKVLQNWRREGGT